MKIQEFSANVYKNNLKLSGNFLIEIQSAIFIYKIFNQKFCQTQTKEIFFRKTLKIFKKIPIKRKNFPISQKTFFLLFHKFINKTGKTEISNYYLLNYELYQFSNFVVTR